MKDRYRIVRSIYGGYLVQVWSWWLPLWVDLIPSKKWETIEKAEEFARSYANPKGRIVKDLGRL